jgi:cytoskeletal protein CcmA (bactofilin family)
MKELNEIRFNGSNVLLKDNLVKGSIIPEQVSELTRDITIQEDTVIEGAVYAHRLEIQNGDCELRGAVFTQLELYVNADAKGNIVFRKSVGSVDTIASRASGCQLTFQSDINAKSVTLYNAFVAGSIYADEVVLDNCVVIGGVFATQGIEMNNCIVGTFNTPTVSIDGTVQLLLPSAFSIEKMVVATGAKFYNLSLADLGALYKGMPQAPESGRVVLDVDADEVRTTLTSEEMQKTLRSYTIVGKVLAADLIDTDKFQNHFLLAAAALGPQLLKTYDLGPDKDGKTAVLSFDRLREFFFGILRGTVAVQDMQGNFSINEVAQKYQ